jgi:hypothetical protein
MKHTTLKTFALLGLFIMLASVSVSAQTATGQMRASIPFDFVAGKAKLKAGEYKVSHWAGKIMVLRRVDERKDNLVFAAYTVQRPGEELPGQLVFHRYGDEYFLAAIWTNGQPIGNGLSQPATERRLARELAKTKTRPQFVEIVARTN